MHTEYWWLTWTDIRGRDLLFGPMKSWDAANAFAEKHGICALCFPLYNREILSAADEMRKRIKYISDAIDYRMERNGGQK